MTTHTGSGQSPAPTNDEIADRLAVALSSPTLPAPHARLAYEAQVNRLMPVVKDLIDAAVSAGVRDLIATAETDPGSLSLLVEGRRAGLAEAAARVLALLPDWQHQLTQMTELAQRPGREDAAEYAMGAVVNHDHINQVQQAVGLPESLNVLDQARSAAYRRGYADCKEGLQRRDPYASQEEQA